MTHGKHQVGAEGAGVSVTSGEDLLTDTYFLGLCRYSTRSYLDARVLKRFGSKRRVEIKYHF